MDIFKEFLRFLLQRKKIWMIPIFMLLFTFGFLIIFVEGTAIAPFIYTLF